MGWISNKINRIKMKVNLRNFIWIVMEIYIKKKVQKVQDNQKILGMKNNFKKMNKNKINKRCRKKII